MVGQHTTKARTTGAAKKAGYKLGEWVAKGNYHLSKRSARSILRGAQTTAGKVRLDRHMRQIDGHKMEDLSDLQEKRLRMVIARSGDDGVKAINNLDEESVKDLLDLRPSCSRGSFSVTVEGGSCLDKATIDDAIQTIVKSAGDEDISEDELRTAVRRLTSDEEGQTTAIRLVSQTSEDGIEILNDINRLQRSDELNFDEEDSVELMNTMYIYKDASGKNIRNIEEIEKDLNILLKDEPAGLGEAIKERTTTDSLDDAKLKIVKRNFKGQTANWTPEQKS